MKKEITWEAKDGKGVTITVALETEKRIWADGDEAIVPTCDLVVSAEVDGLGCVGSGRPEKIAERQGCVARIGKLGLAADKLALIDAAIMEIESTPEWQAKIARQAQARRESEEYKKHRELMRKAMEE